MKGKLGHGSAQLFSVAAYVYEFHISPTPSCLGKEIDSSFLVSDMAWLSRVS